MTVNLINSVNINNNRLALIKTTFLVNLIKVVHKSNLPGIIYNYV